MHFVVLSRLTLKFSCIYECASAAEGLGPKYISQPLFPNSHRPLKSIAAYGNSNSDNIGYSHLQGRDAVFRYFCSDCVS